MKIAATVTICVWAVSLFAAPLLEQAYAEERVAVPSAGQQSESPEYRANLELARGTAVEVVISGEGPRAAKLRPDPVLLYGDQTRDITASALWAWMDGDSPVLLQKIEVYDRDPVMPKWVLCYSSLSPGELNVSWEQRESCRTSPVKFLDVADAEPPSDNANRRLLQMRGIARGLSVVTEDAATKRELRLMPKPLLEFQDPQRGVVSGAVFAFAYGTNPDVCLIVRAMAEEGQPPRWQMAPVRMTSAGIQVSNKAMTLWTEPDSRQTGHFGHWGYFSIPRNIQ